MKPRKIYMVGRHSGDVRPKAATSGEIRDILADSVHGDVLAYVGDVDGDLVVTPLTDAELAALGSQIDQRDRDQLRAILDHTALGYKLIDAAEGVSGGNVTIWASAVPFAEEVVTAWARENGFDISEDRLPSTAKSWSRGMRVHFGASWRSFAISVVWPTVEVNVEIMHAVECMSNALAEVYAEPGDLVGALHGRAESATRKRSGDPVLMSRELKRVPLDFKWPLNKVWSGFLNHYANLSIDCVACAKSGLAPQAKLFGDQWYGVNRHCGDHYVEFDPVAYGSKPLAIDDPTFVAVTKAKCDRHPEYYYGEAISQILRTSSSGKALESKESLGLRFELERMYAMWSRQWCHQLSQADVDALVSDGVLRDFTHAWSRESGWVVKDPPYHPTADEVNAWSMSGFGHSGSGQYRAIEARCARAGVPVKCEACDGQGYTWPSKEIEVLCESWEPLPPPAGDGYQLWETCSEGSPVSPVFATMEALCEHAATHCSTFGSSNFVSAQRWREMLDAGYVYHQEGNVVFT